MKKLCLLFLLLGYALMLLACSASSTEKSVLEKSGCKLPCWNNIVAGQTTKDEFLRFVQGSADVDQSSIQISNQPWHFYDNTIFFGFKQDWSLSQKYKVRVDTYIINNIVSDMIICGELNTTMGDVVTQIGEPENIISGDNVSGTRSVILINSQKGVSYWYSTNSTSSSGFEITSEVKIDCVDLFDSAIYKKMLEAGLFSGGFYNTEETLKVMYPWDGYGDLNLKYPPRQP